MKKFSNELWWIRASFPVKVFTMGVKGMSEYEDDRRAQDFGSIPPNTFSSELASIVPAATKRIVQEISCQE